VDLTPAHFPFTTERHTARTKHGWHIYFTTRDTEVTENRLVTSADRESQRYEALENDNLRKRKEQEKNKTKEKNSGHFFVGELRARSVFFRDLCVLRGKKKSQLDISRTGLSAVR